MNWFRRLIGLKGDHHKTNPEAYAHGRIARKNPFRGIACSNGSNYPLNFFRHVEGARDTRHARPGTERPFRDVNWHPVSFSE